MRITRDKLNMDIAELMAQRSTCTRAQVGCVITRDGRIISSGYNGAPSGMPHCTDVGCKEDPGSGSCTRTSHAEAGAIAYAARSGVALNGSTAYVTHAPCVTCAKLLINAGVIEVVYLNEYRGRDGVEFLRDGKVVVRRLYA